MSPAPSEPADTIGSPFKRQRASLAGLEGGILGPIGSNSNDVFPPATLAAGHSQDQQTSTPTPTPATQTQAKVEDEDEEL
jgi:hypothetical protein